MVLGMKDTRRYTRPMTAPAPMTADELERLPSTGRRGENVLPGFTRVLSEVL